MRHSFGSGIKHWNWKGGIKPCIECGTIIKMRYSKRCQKCDRKFRVGKNSSCWKGGYPKCIDCGEILKKGYKRNIKIRCHNCSVKFRTGKNHPNWQGGITSFYQLLRNHSFSIEWRNEIFKRDKFTCQECGDSKGGNLNAHHIKPFAFILKEFLQVYNNFSPMEDRKMLIKLAERYEPFWDISNGITLCEKCHNKIYRRIVCKL